MQIMPTVSAKPVPCSLRFGAGLDAVEYRYVPFRWVRAGTEEAELASAKLPVRISITFDIHKRGKVNFTENFRGQDVLHIVKIFDAISVALRDKQFSLYNTEDDWPFPTFKLEATDWPDHWQMVEKVARLVLWATKGKGGVLFPEAHSEADDQTLRRLHNIRERRPIRIDGFSASLGKLSEEIQPLEGALQGGNSLALVGCPYSVELWGSVIELGPVTISIPKPSFLEPERLLEEWRSAKVDDTVTLKMGPVEIFVDVTE